MRARRLVRTDDPGIYTRGGRYVVVYRDASGRQHKEAAASLTEARNVQVRLRSSVLDVRREKKSMLRRAEKTAARLARDELGAAYSDVRILAQRLDRVRGTTPEARQHIKEAQRAVYVLEDELRAAMRRSA